MQLIATNECTLYCCDATGNYTSTCVFKISDWHYNTSVDAITSVTARRTSVSVLSLRIYLEMSLREFDLKVPVSSKRPFISKSRKKLIL